jgi:gas vesicle protein
MSAKQDRTYARTAQDLERKYSFGKTFADMLGLINDNRDKVDSVESSLRNEITEQSTTLKRDAEQIVMQATETVKKELSDSISDIDENVSALNSKVEMKLDADAVTIEVQKEIAKGVDRVVTKTGYEFGDDGLNIAKSGEEMSNTLDHTGMYVKRNGDEILTANNKGVEALNLHAKDYLIVGSGDGRSRFEDYGINRTGCFWVGD